MLEAAAESWRTLPSRVRRPFDIVATTIRLYVEDGCSTYAAAIAYYAIFSIIPLSLITLSVVGLVIEEDRIAQWIFDQIPLKETESVRESVDEIVKQARRSSPASLGLGFLFLVWASSGIFGAVRKGLSAAAHLRRGRPYWHGKLIDFVMIPALGVLIVLSVGLTATARLVLERVDEIGPFNIDTNTALRIAGYVLPAMVSFSMFSLLYRYVPTVRPPWREALGGALFATVLFEAAKNLLATFFAIADFSRDTAIYASFGTALAFLVWMFVNASILLLGAEFGRAIRREAGEALADDIPVSPEYFPSPVAQSAKLDQGPKSR
ncbi:MAG: YihY/virulence factor BrkB family protein [Dehalococcoidia bacterium]|jgi:membrane protein|uniref:YihY/virulence factor BrkB family protein n=1 Tax=Candidatus Amarobacter glycogenicus TaxID=3140699 RepID=UPI003135E83A|nr:YihY/virulence factor BrkB family protein [Dehalococcoidia bacterium]